MSEDLLIRSAVDARGVQRGLREIETATAATMRAVERSAADLKGFDVAGSSAQQLNAQLSDSVRLLGQMGAELRAGGDLVDPADLTALRGLVTEQHALAQATAGAETEARQLAEALAALDGAGKQGVNGVQGAIAALSDVRRAQIGWLKDAKGGSVEAQAAYAAQSAAARQAATAATTAGQTATQAAAREAAARREVRAQLTGDIQTLALYGRTVDGTNARAVSAWRSEAAAIRQQAQEVGLSRAGMLKLDAAIQSTERSFQRQAVQAARAAQMARTAAAGPLGAMTQLGSQINTTTGRFNAFGQRGANAAVAVAFGLEAVARGGNAAEGGIRTAARAAASFASMFGPKGLLVGGVIASGVAISELFDRSRKEMEETRKKFEDEIGRMVKAADFTGIQTKARDLFVGDPIKGVDPRTGYFKEGLGALLAEEKALRDRIAEFGPLFAAADVKRLREVTAAIKPLQTEYDALLEVLRNPVRLPRELTGMAPIVSEGLSPEAAARAARAAADAAANAWKDRMRAAAATITRLDVTRELGGSGDEIAARLDDVLAARQAITAEIVRQGAAEAVNIDAVRELLDLATKLRDASQVTRIAIPNLKQQFIDPLPIEQAAVAARGLRLELRAIVTGGRGLLQIGTSLGKIGDRARDAIDGVLGLVDSIGQFKDARKAIESAAKALEAAQKAKDPKGIEAAEGAASAANLAQMTSVIGAIGGAVSMLSGVLGGLFGKSALDKERDQILQRNTEALADLRASLDRSTQSLGGRAEVAADVQRIGMRGFAEAIGKQAAHRLNRNNISGAEFIDRQLREMGSTLEQVDAIAKDLGLTLRDSKGYFNLEAVQQFLDAIKASADAARKFTTDLSGQRAGQDFLDDVFDVDMTPALRFQREVALLAANTKGLVGNLADLDVSTAAGRAAAEAALRELAMAAKAGRITAEQFGDLDSIDDLVSIILGADNALDEFADTVSEATRAMSNVPTGFRLALNTWAATLPDVPKAPTIPAPATPHLPNTPPPGHNPTRPGTGTPTVVHHYHYGAGSIVVEAAERSAADLYDEIEREGRTRTRGTSGAGAASRFQLAT